MTPDECEYWRRIQLNHLVTQPLSPLLPPMMTIEEWNKVQQLALDSTSYEEFVEKFMLMKMKNG